MTSAAELLAAYDEQARVFLPGRQPAGVSISQDGPLLRVSGRHRGYIVYRDLSHLTGAALDALIERACQFFGGRGEAFEWTVFGHDRTSDLVDRLQAVGFVAAEPETVMISPPEQVPDEPELPAGVRIREAGDRVDFDRIAVLLSEVWNDDWGWLADELAARKATEAQDIAIFVAEAGTQLVSAAWLARNSGTDFAGLWGGATLAAWRGKGIYRALVARRAKLAIELGIRYLQVDASADSAPILQRLGFVAVTTTTPYLWTPPGGQG